MLSETFLGAEGVQKHGLVWLSGVTVIMFQGATTYGQLIKQDSAQEIITSVGTI